ncbi:hypothetical protein WNY63_21445 [Pseudoalteromonas neustonica]|uniref:HlyD family efflux transporter periplasmic adaptor subunit n=1 Tax=Pseudoalteromonas neustonica TaxID=1840331 RepID=A0ABU9U8X0_9GAMM
MIIFLPFIALSLNGVLNINTPVVEDYIYSTEVGEVVRSSNTQDRVVNQGDFLLSYSAESTGKLVNISSTLNGEITYRSKLKKGSKFAQGELLFKVKGNEVYGILQLEDNYIFDVLPVGGTLLCAEAYSFPLEIIKVNKKVILVSIKVHNTDSLKNISSGTQEFQVCEE